MVAREHGGSRFGHRRNLGRGSAVIRRIGQAVVVVLALLILIAEIQRGEDGQAQREIELLYGARP